MKTYLKFLFLILILSTFATTSKVSADPAITSSVPPKEVLITGFGPFGPAGNPCIPNASGAVLPYLKAEMKTQCDRPDVNLSFQGPLKVEKGIIETVPGFSSADLIMSMGCDPEAKAITVEVGAVNTFLDYELEGEPTSCNSTMALGCYQECKNMPDNIAGTYAGYQVKMGIPNDPQATYVCNDTLFNTLTKSGSKDGIFLHIPPNKTTVGLKKEAKALAGVMCKIVDSRFSKPDPVVNPTTPTVPLALSTLSPTDPTPTTTQASTPPPAAIDPTTVINPEVKDLINPSSTDPFNYPLLEPLTLKDGTVISSFNTEAGQEGQGLSGMINFILEIAIGIAGVLGVVMLTVFGFQYAANDKNINTFAELRKKILNVVFGLMLLLGIFIILRTINPDLLIVEPEISVLKLSEDQKLALSESGVDINSIKGVPVSQINGAVATAINRSKVIQTVYIPARDTQLPAVPNPAKIFITAHAQKEGFFPGPPPSKSWRTNNPGNIRPGGNQSGYPSLAAGIQAQYDFLKNVSMNQELNYKIGTPKRNCGGFTYDGTLDKYLKIYTPDACNGSYLNFMIGYFKKENITITGQTKVSEIFYMK